MITLPIEGIDGSLLVLIVLEPGNLARMKTGDPVSLPLGPGLQVAGLGVNVPCGKLNILIAYEEDLEAYIQFAEKRDMKGAIKYACRGWQTKDDDGAEPILLRRPS